MAAWPEDESFNSIVIRDLIHDYVHVLYPEERDIIQTAFFQRLRRINQHALAAYTYPALTVSRFEHSLGVMHLADQILLSVFLRDPGPTAKAPQACDQREDGEGQYSQFRKMCDEFIRECGNQFSAIDGHSYNPNDREQREEIKEQVRRTLRLFSLLHDIGHVMFSHAGEAGLEEHATELLSDSEEETYREFGAYHEYLTKYLIERQPDIRRALGEYEPLVLAILDASENQPESVFFTLRKIVDSDVDADRGDYILRDGSQVGNEFGRYDIQRIIDNMIVYNHGAGFWILPTENSLSVLERFLSERYNLYKWVYNHHHVRFSSAAVGALLSVLLSNEIAWPEEVEEYLERNLAVLRLSPEDTPLFPDSRDYFLDTGYIVDDYWMFTIFREIYRLLHPEVDEDSDSKIRFTVRLLEYVLFRRNVGTSLWKHDTDFVRFGRDYVYPALRESARRLEGSSGPYQAEKEYVGASYQPAVGNVMVDMVPEGNVLIKEIQERLNTELLEIDSYSNFSLLLVPFDFTIFDTNDPGILVEEADGSIEHPSIDKASPLLRAIAYAHFWDAHYYAYLICLSDDEKPGQEIQNFVMRRIAEVGIQLVQEALNIETVKDFEDAIEEWQEQARE